MNKIFFVLLSIFAIACNNNGGNPNEQADENNSNPPPPVLSYEVMKVYPHDTSSYTQGLIWYDNTLYEGTGNYEKSSLIKDDVITGKPLQKIKISKDSSVFGEGITIFDNKIYQLTWQTNKVYVYDLKTLKKIQEFTWEQEGWGITHDDKSLIVSTGSSNLYYVNPPDFKIQKIVGVFDNYGPTANLNELEYVNGYIYANQYETDYILKINPGTGKVDGKLDLKDIRQNNKIPIDDHQNVLNGIAYDSARNSFYITGKLWPALFEIKIK